MYILSKDKSNLVEASNIYIKKETVLERHVNVTRYRIYEESRKRPEEEKTEVFLMGSYRYYEEAAKEVERIADALSSGATVYKIS